MDETARAQVAALKRRVETLEQHIRMIYERVGMDTSGLFHEQAQIDPELAEMLRAGRTVQAIKVYSQIHGVDLMTAKNAIERMHAEGNY